MADDGGVWAKVWPDSVGVPEATITAITGSGITHTYGDFVAFEFLTSGSLTCTEGTVPEALIVAGGGGGGRGQGNGGSISGAGGGAGGYVSLTEVFLSSGSNTITIGAGGANSTNGSDTGFANITAVGGGRGHGELGEPGKGGSGGGSWNVPSNLGGAGTLNQGNNGGVPASEPRAGGGGGAGAVGGNGTGPAGGVGGAGLASSITGTSVFRAGGGGGALLGAGGNGGGGAGADYASVGGSGTANTGGGGGGGIYGDYNGGPGGNGVVIVKVKASNAANVDKSGWTEVTAAMLAAAEKKRELERKAQAKKAALQAKNEELSGATQTDIKETE